MAVSFGVDERLFGLAPEAYALTNLGLVVAIAVSIAALARSLGFDPLFGVVAASLWTLNFHGVGGALMWISGRTSLVTTLFAILAGAAFAHRRSIVAGGLTLCALLSKEEPVLLPVVFALWTWIDMRAAGVDPPAGEPAARVEPARVALEVLRRTGPSWAALGVYLVLRSTTHAFTPSTAPAFYRLSLSPGVVLPNGLQYFDRACTFVLAVVLFEWLVFSRRLRPRLDPLERRNVLKGFAWLVLGYGVTVTLPARSSLYACLPSVGSALLGAAVAAAVWRDLARDRRRTAVAFFAVLPVFLLPVYWARNVRLKDEAELSTRALQRLAALVQAAPRVDRVVVYDDPAARPSISSAFGEALPEAIELTTGRVLPVDIVPHSPDASHGARGHPGTIPLVLRRGDLVPVE